jgi:ketosteroid isomerase-like protein
MANNGPFNIDPEDFDRFAKEASDGLRDVVDQVGKFFGQTGAVGPWGAFFGDASTTDPAPAKPKPARESVPEPETTGAKGDGVWTIYIVDDEGLASIDQVFASELDALRAHKDNTDPARKVRFLPYGLSVSVLEN